MLRPFRDACVVAAFDLEESLRSRRVVIFLVLYALGAVGATILFTELLQDIEVALAEQLLVARTTQPGSLTQAIMESPELHRVLSRVVDDPDVATELLALPPVALLYHWFAIGFAPVFVVLTASDAISAEVASGSVRYALFRTDRVSWLVGKLLGQAALLFVGLALGAVGAWVTGAVQLSSFEGARTALWLARFAGTAFFFAFAHLGLAMGISQLTRSVPWSRALGLLALAGVFMGYFALGPGRTLAELAPVLAESVRQLLPAAHRFGLWRLDAAIALRSALVLFALGCVYFSMGALRFSRRDA